MIPGRVCFTQKVPLRHACVLGSILLGPEAKVCAVHAEAEGKLLFMQRRKGQQASMSRERAEDGGRAQAGSRMVRKRRVRHLTMWARAVYGTSRCGHAQARA